MRHTYCGNRRPWTALAVLTAAVTPVVPAYAKTVIASWLSPADGFWSTAANWSTAPNYPNNGFPNKTDYDVRITPSGSPYTVYLNTADVAINSLTITSSSATLDHSYGALIVPNLTLSAGAYVLRGGTLRDATVSGAGSFHVDTAAPFNILDNVSLGTSLTLLTPSAVGSSAYSTSVRNGLDLLNNAAVTLNAGGLDFWGTQTLGGTGDVVFNGPASTIVEGSNGTLTIGSGVRIRTGAGSGTIARYYDTDAVHNYGTLSSNTAGNTLTLSHVTNYGTVEAANGGHLNLYGFQNAGTVNVSGPGKLFVGLDWSTSTPINVTGADVELAGNFTTASLRNVNRTGAGGSLIITGTVDNAGQTLALDSITGAWPLYNYVTGGTVKGGTVTALNPATGLTLPYSSVASPLPEPGGTLDSVTLDTNLTLNSYLTLRGDVTLPAGRRISLRQGANTATGLLQLYGGSQLLGSGEVVFDTGTSTIRPTIGSATVGPQITVRTAFGSGIIGDPNYGSPTNRLTLQGLVSAPIAGQFIRVQGHWSSTGTFQATNSGIIVLTGTSDSLGTLRASSGGSIRLAGLTYDNTGKTLTADANSGTLSLGTFTDTVERITTIRGGTLASAGSHYFDIGRGSTNSVPGAKFDGITLAGNVTVINEGELHVANGLTFNGGRISLLGASAQANMTGLFADGTQTWSGNGEIVFDGTTFYSHVAPTSGILTIGPGITIRTGAAGGAVGEFKAGTLLVNQGTISARFYKNITVWGNWDNTLGTFEADNATLYLSGNITTDQLGTRRTRNNGTISFGGTLDNTGRTLTVNDSTGHFTIYGATGGGPSLVTGGTLAATANAHFFLSNLILDGVTLSGTSYVAGSPYANNTVTVHNDLTLDNGTLLMDPARVITFPGAQSILGAGAIAPFTSSTGPTVSGDTLTIGPSVTLRAGKPADPYGTFLYVSTTDTLINQGTLSADQPLGVLNVTGGLNNQGTIQAVNQGTVRLTSPAANRFANTGTLQASSGGTLELLGPWSSTGTILVDNASLNLGGSFATSSLSGLHRTNGGTVTLTGSLDNSNATLDLTGTLGPVTVAGGTITGGTVRGATSGPAATLAIAGPATATLDGVTLDADVTANAPVVIKNTVSIAADRTVSLGIGSSLTFSGTATLDGPGALSFGASTSITYTLGRPTFGPTITVHTGTRSGTIGPSFLNQGTLSARTPGQSLTLSGYWYSTGTLEAINGSTLNLTGEWSSTGTIRVDNATLNLSGKFPTSALSSVQRNGGTISISGTLNNANSALSLNAASGNVQLGTPSTPANINGGTLTTSGGAMFEVASASTLNSVTLNGDVVVQPYQTLFLDNVQPSTAPARIFVRDGAVSLVGSETLAGPIEVIFDGPSTLPGQNSLVSTVGTVTIGPDVVVRTGRSSGTISYDRAFVNYGTVSAQTPMQIIAGHRPFNHGLIAASNSSGATIFNFVNEPAGTMTATTGGTLDLIALSNGNPIANNGTISADAGTIKLSGPWSNAGTISVVNGSTLNLSGAWTNTGTISAADSTVVLAGLPASLGNFSAARSTIAFSSGTLTAAQVTPFAAGANTVSLNSGMTLSNAGSALDISDLNLKLAGATISGGTLTSSAIPLTVTSGSLTTVTVNAPVNFGPPTLKGTYSLTTTDTTFNGPVSVNGGPADLGATSRLLLNGAWSNTSSLSVTNGSLTLSALGSNTGTITLNNSSLTFASFPSLGTVSRTNTPATFAGTIDNAGATFDPNLTPIGAVALGSGSRVNGGTLASASPVSVTGTGTQANEGFVTFDAVTLAADVDLAPTSITPVQSIAGRLRTLNGLTFSSPRTVTANSGATVQPSGSQSYTGPGTILLSGGRIDFTAAAVTFGPDITVRSAPTPPAPGGRTGSSFISFRNSSTSTTPASLTNDGIISAETPASSLVISGPSLTNNGTLRAANGSTLSLSTATMLTNYSSSANGSTLSLSTATMLTNYSSSANGTLTGGSYVVEANSTLSTPGLYLSTNAATVLLSGPNSAMPSLNSLYTNAGSLTLTNGRSFATQSSFTNSGSITLGPSATLTLTGHLANPGTIDFSAPTASLLLTAGVPREQAGPIRQMILSDNLTSSFPDPADLYSIGYLASPTSLLVKLTYTGDANLDGSLDTDDYVLIDRAFALALLSPGWYDGDFDHSGTVDQSDYLLIDATFGKQQPGTLSPDFLSLRESQFGEAYVSALLASVPEPGSFGTCVLGALVGLNKRLRRPRSRTS